MGLDALPRRDAPAAEDAPREEARERVGRAPSNPEGQVVEAEIAGDEALLLVVPVETDPVEARARKAAEDVARLLRAGKRKIKLWGCSLEVADGVAYFGDDDAQLWSSDPSEIAAWFVGLASVVMPLDTAAGEV